MLDRLRDLALDLTWTWDGRIRDGFAALDPERWRLTENPVTLLRDLGPEGVDRAYGDGARDAIDGALAAAAARRSLGTAAGAGADPVHVAYFSLEFGLAECLTIYSGGLGIIAGDHLKAASDAGVRLTGVGLMYRYGFGHQRIDGEGRQYEEYQENLPADLPMERVTDAAGEVTVEVPLGSQTVHVGAFRVRVGRVPLLLLDTNLEINPEDLRDITDRLYVSEPSLRLRQEIVLGIGGIRMLRRLGVDATVFHMNEGHSFLVGIERIRELKRTRQLNLEEARLAARTGIVFTTHTPVAAGSDYFSPELVQGLLGPYLDGTGMPLDHFLDLGRAEPGNAAEPLCTTYVGLRLAGHSVGVSRLHGEVSRRLWRAAWPRLPEASVPIGSVTNGVHIPTWLAPELAEFVSEHAGPEWMDAGPDDPVWSCLESLPLRRLWEIHARLRERLVEFARQRTPDAAGLEPEALTIGFSRRFAPYKRATLLLTDRERLRRLVNSPGRPVQFVFAGKAHPADGPGKELLREVVRVSREEPRVVFLEDYDICVARHLVQGCDVWLNNPRRFLEASGTSGMKAGANGVLNVSILDGWWDEAYHPSLGWAIPSGATIERPAADDEAEAENLYRLLEREVIPLFYRRVEGVPEEWARMMRASMRLLGSRFSARRMVLDYVSRAYAPAARAAAEMRLLSDWGG